MPVSGRGRSSSALASIDCTQEKWLGGWKGVMAKGRSQGWSERARSITGRARQRWKKRPGCCGHIAHIPLSEQRRKKGRRDHSVGDTAHIPLSGEYVFTADDDGELGGCFAG